MTLVVFFFYKIMLKICYTNLKIKYSNIFHDRFIIIDNNLYHVGASLKDLGKKCFGINKIEDKDYLDKLLSKFYNEKLSF